VFYVCRLQPYGWHRLPAPYRPYQEGFAQAQGEEAQEGRSEEARQVGSFSSACITPGDLADFHFPKGK
jgi:hypothetical protein